MTAHINGKFFPAKLTNGRYFYWSHRAVRWLPVAKEKVTG